MDEKFNMILLKIANGIGNTDSDISIIDYAKIGGCDKEELITIESAIKETITT